MSAGVVLLAHGTPESLDEMPEYLRLVRGGREPSPELVEEMRRNYAAIGGRSPLTEITLAQAAALRRALGDGTPVFVGMRNWRPLIADALRDAAAAGVERLVAVPLAPQYSALSVGKYKEAVERSRPEGMALRFVDSWHDHPGLLDAFAEKLRAAMEDGWDEVKNGDAVCFNRCNQRFEIEPFHHNLTCAGSQRRVHQHHAVDVGQRQEYRIHIVRSDAAAVKVLQLIADERPVREHHAFGETRRTA